MRNISKQPAYSECWPDYLGLKDRRALRQKSHSTRELARCFEAVQTDARYSSDQLSFEEAGKPSIAIHAALSDMMAYLHTSKDVRQTVDPKVLAAVVDAAVAGLTK